MADDNIQMSTLDTFKIEVYKSMNRWNMEDEQSLISRDKFLLTASVGACVASLMRYADVYHFVYFGSLTALSYWIILSFRYKWRINTRLAVIRRLEEDLGYLPYEESDFRLGRTFWLLPRDTALRASFFVLFIFGMFPPILTELGETIKCLLTLYSS